jgi:restriction endonuclease S subunit
MEKSRLEAGEVILVRSGVNAGDCAVVPESLAGSYAAYDLILHFKDNVLPAYVISFLYTHPGKIQIALLSGRAAQPHLNAEEIASIQIPLPPLATQRALVAEMQAAREARKQKLAQADALLAGLDAYLLEQLGIAPPQEDKRRVFAVRLEDVRGTSRLNSDYFHPERVLAIRAMQEKQEGLRVERLADIADFVRDLATVTVEAKYIGLASVQSNTGELVETVEEEAEGACLRYAENDVLFARLRPYLNKVHRAEKNGTCSTEFHVIRIRDDGNVLPDYLAAILRSSLILVQTRHMMTGNTHPRLTNDDVVNLVIPIPDLRVQQTIAAEVKRRREQARQLRAQAAAEWDAAKVRFEEKLLGG